MSYTTQVGLQDTKNTDAAFKNIIILFHFLTKLHVVLHLVYLWAQTHVYIYLQYLMQGSKIKTCNMCVSQPDPITSTLK